MEKCQRFQGSLSDHETYRALVEALQENVIGQRKNPKKVIQTFVDLMKVMEDGNMKEGYNEDIVCSMVDIRIENCLFRESDGTEVFSGTLNDGLVHLMFQFSLIEETEECDRFTASDMYAQFADDKNGNIHTFSIDCGDNIELAAEIYSRILIETFDSNYDLYSFTTSVESSKKDAQKKALKNARK